MQCWRRLASLEEFLTRVVDKSRRHLPLKQASGVVVDKNRWPSSVLWVVDVVDSLRPVVKVSLIILVVEKNR